MGVEMAEATLRRGLETTLITRSDVMSSLDPDMSMRVSTALKEAGVEVVTGTEVGSLTRGPTGAVNGVVTADGRICRADVVVLGSGVRTASELGAQAGLALGRSGGYLPDPRGRIGDGVWAAGDCCEAISRITGEYVFVPLGTHANKQGGVVGDNLAGCGARFGGVLGTAITRLGDVAVAGGNPRFQAPVRATQRDPAVPICDMPRDPMPATRTATPTPTP